MEKNAAYSHPTVSLSLLLVFAVGKSLPAFLSVNRAKCWRQIENNEVLICRASKLAHTFLMMLKHLDLHARHLLCQHEGKVDWIITAALNGTAHGTLGQYRKGWLYQELDFLQLTIKMELTSFLLKH